MPEPTTQPKPRKLKRFLVPRQIKLMLSVLLRDAPTFRLVKDQLDPARFPEDMKHFAGVWNLVREHYDQHNTLMSQDQLSADTENWIQGAEIDDRDLADLSDVINDAFSMNKKEVAQNRGIALKYVQRFLEESVQRDLQKSVSSQTAVELPALLEAVTKRVQAIQSISTGEIDVPFPEDLTKMEAIEKHSTGCEFLDRYMGGGQAAREVYGFCAPYGVCKTTLCIQLAVNRARFEQSEWRKNGKKGPLPIVYVFFYESEKQAVLPAALAYAANVERVIIEDGRWGDMSTSEKKNYKKYEYRDYAGQFESGITVKGERERLEVAKKQLNRNLRLLDFSGGIPEYQEVAGQYIEGIVSLIERDQILKGRPGVSAVFLDYAGAIADRHCSAKNLDMSKNLRFLIGKMPMRLKNQIAVPMKCPVWVMHQLGTEANSKQAGVVPKPTDTAEAKNFFENVNFGFMVGTKTLDELVVMTNGKQRRNKKLEDTILRIDGLYSRVVGTDNDYRIDNSKIVRKDEANAIRNVGTEDDDDDDDDDVEEDGEDELRGSEQLRLGPPVPERRR
jgi:hypothetical protein